MTRGNGSTMSSSDTPNRIREWRARRRMSLAELGETVGLSRSEISKLENGSRRVRADHLVALAKALKVPPEELMDKETVRDMLGELPPPSPTPGPSLPILQARRQDGQIVIPAQEPTALSLPAPPQLANVPGAYAFYMPDTSFEPRVPVGALLFVNTILPPRAGDLAVIALEEGEPFLSWVEREGDKLLAFSGKNNPAADLGGRTVVRAHRIAGLWFS
jgi:transcriptional regulator with XRE-family HTH domain